MNRAIGEVEVAGDGGVGAGDSPPAGGPGSSAAGLSVECAADILWLLAGSPTFDELYSGRGLDVDECARVPIDIARSTILADGDPTAPSVDAP